ncbi:ABC transporter ATP-binding protein [Clostridium sp.]|uniref:ABC transporter ATP-binding protein n=1 Tax=Clostridium sp. TaxID=1506 RepID=UPI00260DC616|nr:ABC transporter ATP-binding protein [Clostridium sp.]
MKLSVKDYSLKYNNNIILDKVSFELEKGRILGIIGPSGAGKTSLIKALVGIYASKPEEISLDNEGIYDNKKVKEKIAFVPDEQTSFYLITVIEAVNYYKSIYKKFNEDKFFKLNKIFKIPINKRFMQLSKGMKVRVNLMLALSIDSELIVLDEPTSGLDPILKQKVIDIISKEVQNGNRSIIISSHNLSDLEQVCDDILIINNGTVNFYNSLETLKNNIRKIQIAFDKPIYEEDLKIEGVTSIKSVGRVFTLITESYNEEFIKRLESKGPLFIEEIDLSLEEIFISKLGGEKDYEEIFK